MKFLLLTIALPLLVTTLAYSIFYAGRDVKFVGNIADQAMAMRMSLRADTEAPRPGAHPIIFLDFDEKTSARLGDPVLVPPRMTARALNMLAPLKPWAIVVDLDISYVRDEAELAELRAAIAAAARQGTAVLIGRDSLPGIDPRQAARLRSTPLDPFVAGMPGILWTSAAHYASDDGAIRGLPPMQPVRDGGKDVALPAVPLVLKLLAMESGTSRLDAIVADGLAGRSRCGAAGVAKLRFCTGSGPLDLDRKTPVAIGYSLSWPPDPARLPRIDTAPQARRLSMLPLTRATGFETHGAFRDAIVFVGATAGRRDLHATPFGEMPGAFILANAARDWIEFGPREDSFWPGLLVTMFATILLTGTAWLLLAIAPARWRNRIRAYLPPALTMILWILFIVLGNPAAAIGLVVTAYLVVTTICFCHEHSERVRGTSSSGEGPSCDTV